jgi:hypothetical protein
VRALVLGPLGENAGREQLVAAAPQAVEVDAAASGRRVAIAWIVDFGEQIETLSAFSLDAGRSFARPQDLGGTIHLPRGQRGRLSMGTSGDSLMLYHRLPPGPCTASHGTCALFTRHAIGSDTSPAQRGRATDEVAAPCEPLISGAIERNDTWYHLVCDREAGARTTMFAFRAEVSYAAAVPLIGCSPLGIAPLDSGVAVVASCTDGVQAWQFDEMARELAHFAPLERSVECSDARPVVRIGHGSSQRTLHLGEATDRIDPLLPEAIAPIGARAIWTGESLLVASVIGREVTLHRYQCVRDRFDRTD